MRTSRATIAMGFMLVTGCAPAPSPSADGAQAADATTPDGAGDDGGLDGPGPAVGASWTRSLCNMYEAVPWARTVRGPGAPAVRDEGFRLLDERGELVEARLANLVSKISERLDSGARDLVVSNGGIVSAKDGLADEFLAFVSADGGERWRSILRRQFAEVDALPGADHVLWQVGNEINSRCHDEAYRRFVAGEPPLDPRECSDGEFGVGVANQLTAIEPYVEFDLAPTVEAHRASRARSRLMLGSLANAGNAASRAWLAALLDQPIQGRYAPSLRGRGLRVRDVVEVVSYHYLVTKSGMEAGGGLDELLALRRGQVTALWATEELGGRRADVGDGAATTVRVLAQSLDLWAQRGLGPDVARVCIFAARGGLDTLPPERRVETTGDYALGLVLGHVGQVALVPAPTVRWVGASTLELHPFAAPGRRLVVVLTPPVGATTTLAPGTIDLGAGLAGARVAAHRLGRGGDTVTELEVDAAGRLALAPSGLQLAPNEAALVLITPP